MTHLLLAFNLDWNIELRGILVVALAVVVLPGSIYMILSTNLGTRLGFLVALAGVFGWITIMATIWTTYAIGYVGTAPSWKVKEVVTSNSVNDLHAAALPQAHDLSTWHKLAADDPKRGEAQASVSAAIAGTAAAIKVFDADTDYFVLDAYDKGGKNRGFIAQNFPGPHPPHYAIVQVERVKAVTVPFGETPPKSVPDPTQPVVSVIMERNLGNKRLPPFLTALGSGIIFAVLCNTLHRRDKIVTAARAAAAAAS
ncbi:MAG: hypothetical protein QOI47_85 [Actinomycetota bacterium]|jgi:hypothetical protein|nr:hypothetical protein [Actinomycetota bacterium]